MSGKSGVVLTVTSPAPDIVQTVELHQETHDAVVTSKHLDMVGHLQTLQTTLEKPTIIVESSTRKDAVLFINENVVSPKQSHPFTAAVKIVKGKGFVSTYHFKKRKPDANVLWREEEISDAS